MVNFRDGRKAGITFAAKLLPQLLPSVAWAGLTWACIYILLHTLSSPYYYPGFTEEGVDIQYSCNEPVVPTVRLSPPFFRSLGQGYDESDRVVLLTFRPAQPEAKSSVKCRQVTLLFPRIETPVYFRTDEDSRLPAIRDQVAVSEKGHVNQVVLDEKVAEGIWGLAFVWPGAVRTGTFGQSTLVLPTLAATDRALRLEIALDLYGTENMVSAIPEPSWIRHDEYYFQYVFDVQAAKTDFKVVWEDSRKNMENQSIIIIVSGFLGLTLSKTAEALLELVKKVRSLIEVRRNPDGTT